MMRFMSAREMRSGSKELWSSLKNEEVILTLNGKPIAILAGVGETNVEETLKAFRRARAEMALESMHQTALRTGASKMTFKEIEAEIQVVRKKRPR
jgi:antitoxin (DNA-binding transcriptional repressor) of toxin-antitoxin stability system